MFFFVFSRAVGLQKTGEEQKGREVCVCKGIITEGEACGGIGEVSK